MRITTGEAIRLLLPAFPTSMAMKKAVYALNKPNFASGILHLYANMRGDAELKMELDYYENCK